MEVVGADPFPRGRTVGVEHLEENQARSEVWAWGKEYPDNLVGRRGIKEAGSAGAGPDMEVVAGVADCQRELRRGIAGDKQWGNADDGRRFGPCLGRKKARQNPQKENQSPLKAVARRTCAGWGETDRSHWIRR